MSGGQIQGNTQSAIQESNIGENEGLKIMGVGGGGERKETITIRGDTHRKKITTRSEVKYGEC